ncbi:hypothetical protein BGZ65_009241, partial [Modicella reniformis]
QGDFKIEGYLGKESKAGPEDLKSSVFKDWLVRFNHVQVRPILLVLDQAMWDLLQRDPEDTSEPQQLHKCGRAEWNNILIVKVPKNLATSLPMAAGLVKMFKRNYFRFLSEDPFHRNHLLSISRAWHEIQKSTIQHSFEAILDSIRELQQGIMPFQTSIDIKDDKEQIPQLIGSRTDSEDFDLQQAVQKVYPSAPETVLQYYQTQDNDIGPSSLLRVKILEMQHDFKDDFGSPPDFGQVSYYDSLGLK